MAKNYFIKLGRFALNTPEYANKRAAESDLKEAHIEKDGCFLNVVAGPYTKKEAEAKMAKLTSENIAGLIYTNENVKEAGEQPEEAEEPKEIDSED